MSTAAPTISIPVDVANPGQFFACCGLLELAHRLYPPAEGWFVDGRFCLACNDEQPDFECLLNAAITCTVDALPTPDPKTAPIKLGDPIDLQLDWWIRTDGSTNLFKTWAANATSQQMFCKWREPLKNNLDALRSNPEGLLTVSEKKQGSYGFDSDLGWDALNVGFSLNEHTGLKKLPTRPAVELLGAVGLQRFFPVFMEMEQVVEYTTWRVPLPAPVARVAVLGTLALVSMHRMRTRFVYRGSFKGLDRATIIQGEPNE